MTIITISRQYGSGGDEIATRIGEILNYPLFDKRLIVQAARDSGLSEQEITDYSEESHQIQGFLDRLFNRGMNTQVGRVWREDATGARVMEEVQMSEDVLIALVQKAVRSAAKTRAMIIVGRGGQAILSGEPGTINVRIEAPMEERIMRVKDQIRREKHLDNTDIELRRRAQDRIVERDAASADYLRRFYHIEWAHPLLYHLVINTGKVGLNQAAELIVTLTKEIEATQRPVEAL